MRARGKDDPHKRRDAQRRAEAEGVDRIPLFEMDYLFVGLNDDKDEKILIRTLIKALPSDQDPAGP